MFESRALESPSLRVQLAERCEGAKPLLARVGYWLASGRGQLTLWVPDDSDPTLLDVLNRGGMSESCIQEDAQHELCSVVRRFLNRVPSGAVLKESQYAVVTDSWIDRFQGETMRLGEVVFIVVRSASEDDGALIQELYAGSAGWLDAWFMCRGDTAIEALRQSNTESSILDEVVASSDEVWFDAFDGDGFVVWSPNAETVAKPNRGG